MATRLAGKRTLVTGAGQGIGRAIALAFAEQGACVTAASRTLSKMLDLPEISSAITPIELDVSDADAIRRTVAEIGAMDVLVNCAGWAHSKTDFKCTDVNCPHSLDQGVSCAFRLIREVLPDMLDRKQGAIVNVASIASGVTGASNLAAYGTSKAAMIGLTKAVACDFIGKGIRCNALCPGAVHCPSLNACIASTDVPQAERRSHNGCSPMRRLGTLKEMAAAAVYLASDDSSFMTGQTMIVDGGQAL